MMNSHWFDPGIMQASLQTKDALDLLSQAGACLPLAEVTGWQGSAATAADESLRRVAHLLSRDGEALTEALLLADEARQKWLMWRWTGGPFGIG